MSSYIPVEFIDEDEFLAIELAIEEATKKLKRCETANQHCTSKDVIPEARITDSLCFPQSLNAELDKISSKLSSSVPPKKVDVSSKSRNYDDFTESLEQSDLDSAYTSTSSFTSDKSRGQCDRRNHEAVEKFLNGEHIRMKSEGPEKNGHEKTNHKVVPHRNSHLHDSSSDSDWLNDWPCPADRRSAISSEIRDGVENHEYKEYAGLSTEEDRTYDYNYHLVLSETEDEMETNDCKNGLISSEAEDASDTDDGTERVILSEVGSETDDCTKNSNLSEANDNKHRSSDNSVNTRRLPSWQSVNRNHGQQVKNTSVSKRTKRVATLGDVHEVKGATKYQNENDPVPEDPTARLPWGFEPPTRKAPVIKPKCQLPSFHFKGRVIYSNKFIDAERDAGNLLRQLNAKKATSPDGTAPLGFDTEWKVVFKRGAPRRKVALLQLCMDSVSCNLFHVKHSGITPSLKTILADPLIEKVGVGAFGDASKLSSDYDVVVEGVKDISTLANFKLRGSNEGLVRNKSWSLTSLCEKLLGKQVEKTGRVRTGNWEKYKLSPAQIKYAATDAFASLYLYQVLLTFPDPKEE